VEDLTDALSSSGSIEISSSILRAVANLSVEDSLTIASNNVLLRAIFRCASSPPLASLTGYCLQFLTERKDSAALVLAAEPFLTLALLAAVQHAAPSVVRAMESLCDIDYETVVREYVKLVKTNVPLMQDAASLLSFLAGSGTRAAKFITCGGLSAFEHIASDVNTTPVSAQYHSVQAIRKLLTAVSAGWNCDGCSKPIQTKRYRCSECQDFDFCTICFGAKLSVPPHNPSHRMWEYPEPLDKGYYLSLLLPPLPPLLERFSHSPLNEVATRARQLLQNLPAAEEQQKTQ